MFVDESGFRLGASPRHGWAPRGEDAPGREVHGRWETITMIGAMSLDGFRGFMTIDAATSADVFEAFVQAELAPNLRPGDIVVMDNLSAHKHPSIAKRITAAGASIRYTPPYSPEFNPIEEAWAKLKDVIRRSPTPTRDAFDTAVSCAIDTITPQNIKSWVQYAGYQVNSG